MTSGDDHYSCWIAALFNSLFTLFLAGVAIGGVVGVVRVPTAANIAGLTAFVVVVGFIEIACWWWIGWEVRIEGNYLAWRSILRRRWIRLDRVAEVTTPSWLRETFAIRTDDGKALRVFVASGYLNSARRFAARVDELRTSPPDPV